MIPVRCQTLPYRQLCTVNPEKIGPTFYFMIQQCLGIFELELQAHMGMASRDVRDELLNRGHIRRNAHGTERLASGGDDIVADSTLELADVEGGWTQKRRLRECGGNEVIECRD